MIEDDASGDERGARGEPGHQEDSGHREQAADTGHVVRDQADSPDTEPGSRTDAGALWAEATTSASTHTSPHAGDGPGRDTDGTNAGDETADTESADRAGASGATEGSGGTDESVAADAVRAQSWSCSQPAELDVSVDVGRVEVSLSESATAVDVELRAEHSWGGGWQKGLTSVFSWLSEATGGGGSIRVGGREFSFGGPGGPHFDLRDLAGRDLVAEAVRSAEVTWSDSARRLVVRSAKTLPARLIPLAVTVRAPAGSRIMLRTGAGPITVTGRADAADVQTGSGDIELDAVRGDLKLRTGSGAATVRSVSGRAKAKTGSGDIRVDTLEGPAEVQSGSGDLRLGGVRADLFARTGSGDLTVADAEAGRLDLTTGSGDLRVGVHPGVAAEVDLRSGSGRARSELDVSDEPPASGEPALRIAGRTGSGNVLVTRALSAAGAAG